MRHPYLLALFLSLLSFCSAEEQAANSDLLIAMGDDNLQDRHMDFQQGYTNLSMYQYHVKVTAEQRYSDKKVLIVVLPQEQAVKFRIQNVHFAKNAPQWKLEGPIARVQGVFSAHVNMSNPVHVRMVIPVQVKAVSEFSISPDEAMIQGNQFVERSPHEMLPGAQSS
jgi:hypothetical protein